MVEIQIYPDTLLVIGPCYAVNGLQTFHWLYVETFSSETFFPHINPHVPIQHKSLACIKRALKTGFTRGYDYMCSVRPGICSDHAAFKLMW